MNRIVQRARQLRSDMTKEEQLLWRYLRMRQVDGHKFRRQVPLGRYIADFACFEAHLIVELDGAQHGEQLEYDERRDAWLRGQGLQVLRFWNFEITQQLEGVYQRIEEALSKTVPPIPALPPQGGKGSSIAPSRDASDRISGSPPRPERGTELRVFGVNACL